MEQVFICRDTTLMPRWRDAFPEAACLEAATAVAAATVDMQAWVVIQGAEWPALVRELSSRGAIVSVLSYAPSYREAARALEAGARGYAHALSTPELLHQIALVTAHQGIWVGPELMAQVVGGAYRALGGDQRLNDDVLAPLTQRERDVTIAVAAGNSNKAVARQLGITERTVKAHLGAVFRKLDVRDRMQLVLKLSRQEQGVS
ncbi:response regulator transcription factor [Halomonas getboli]|uniref:response regulator transcription factor n=1 Tax=Halomonas getboli TaxID=2935862 RepID=UPI001FFE3FE4|nr:response regulator transcription factor [Halomonas getboli]MCK2182934.1 response regulator transcription factor [Halomonas getboli]